MAAMRGYTSSSYGDGFADVYDDWYRDVSDIEATVALVRRLVGDGGRVLELGVGTGRLAIPLAAAGLDVTGVDTSERMLEHLAVGDPDRTVKVVRGDMVDQLPDGPFDAVLVAYNTLFNLESAPRQAACFEAVATRLSPNGTFLVEAFVPVAHSGSQVSVRSMTTDRVVLSASTHRADDQTAEGQYIEISEGGGIRLRPWAIHWSTVEQLDEMAADAGLAVADRWGDVDARPFTTDSERHVTSYRRTARTGEQNLRPRGVGPT